MDDKLLRQSIIQTLAYFDVADYPLTKEELWRWLWQPPLISESEFEMSLRGASEASDEAISSRYGYYFLPGREELAEKRRQRLLISELKMKRARRAIKLIRSAPFLRAVFVCNSVGAERAEENSDIDFFIIAAAGRVWLVRLFTNLILRLFGLRTYGDKITNRVCLSFYVDAANLNLSPLRIMPDDIHFAYWLHQMAPLYDPENYWEKFLRANDWTKEYLPHVFERPTTYSPPVKEGAISSAWRKIWEKMWAGAYGNLIESQARKLQRHWMKSALRELAKKGDKRVVLSDGVIKLHENDRRQAYREEWRKRVNEYQVLSIMY